MVRITLVLAYAPGQPDGNTDDRIEVNAALTPQGQIDRQAYIDDPKPWTVTRQRPDKPLREGELIETEEGWALRPVGEEDDPISLFEVTVLRPGDYATLRRPRGDEQVYRVVNVEAA